MEAEPKFIDHWNVEIRQLLAKLVNDYLAQILGERSQYVQSLLLQIRSECLVELHE
jgi:hypothetical protein